MTTPAPFLSRHLGEYLLVAQLSEDALGTVFRALYAADERRFVRLRILRSDELSPEAIAWTIRQRPMEPDVPGHDALVARPQFDLVDDVPFLCWDESSGWTLDTMLARVRAFGIRIPPEYALLIAERIAAALEHAHRSAPAGRLGGHGLLWPGFVSISHDAAVRVGGFGVAEAILPSLGAARLGAEVAPYVAPECRASRRPSANGDVYSLGAILVELLTGRRPALDAPSAELRAGDPRSEELGGFLRRCLAPASERFASAAEAHRAIQQIVTGNPFSLYTANLALFLYKLLNPESQSAAPSSDWESTNPVVVRDLSATVGAAGLAQAEDLEVRAAGLAARTEEPAGSAPDPIPAEGFPPAEPVAPEPSARREFLRTWARPATSLATAAGVAIGAFLVASQIQSLRSAPVSKKTASAASPVSSIAPAAAPAPAPVLQAASLGASSAAGPVAVLAIPTSGKPAAAARPRAAAGPARKVRPELRRPTEQMRLRAALARIEADRLDAGQAAAEIFVQGRSSEQEGERLLRERDYDAAQAAFSRAALLFQRAQEVTWEERLRRTDLSSAR